MLSLLLLWFHYQDLLMYSTFKPEVEEIIMEDKLPSCINSWDTFVNNNHPLQTEEDAEPLWKDAEPNSRRRTQSPSERTQSPWEDAEPPSHLEGVFVFKDDRMFSISDSTSIFFRFFV